MGEVDRARDPRLDRDVAIKVMAPHVAADLEMRRRLETEAPSIAALSHPSIMAIHELAVVDNQPLAVMELIEGHTLRVLLAQGAVSWREAVPIGTAIAEVWPQRTRAASPIATSSPRTSSLTSLADSRQGSVVFLGVEPALAPLRARPDFDALLTRVGPRLTTASAPRKAST